MALYFQVNRSAPRASANPLIVVAGAFLMVGVVFVTLAVGVVLGLVAVAARLLGWRPRRLSAARIAAEYAARRARGSFGAGGTGGSGVNACDNARTQSDAAANAASGAKTASGQPNTQGTISLQRDESGRWH